MSISYFSNRGSIVLPQKQVKPLVQVVSTITIYLVIFIMTYSDFINSQLSRNSRMDIRIGGLFGGHILSIPILIIVALFTDINFRKLVLGKIGILYSFIIFLYFLIGLIYNNDFKYIKIDLITSLWLLAGCAMFFVIKNSFRPKLQLFVTVLIPTILLIYSCLLQSDRIGGSEATRILFLSIRYSWSLSLILSVALAVFARQKIYWSISIWILVLIHLYAISLSGTRSITLSLVTVILFSLLTTNFKLSQGLLGERMTLFRINKITSIFFIVGFSICIILFSEYILEIIISFVSHFAVFQRLFTDQALSSNHGRISDAYNVFASFQDIDFILGRGIGATYLSPDVEKGMKGFKFWFTHFGILSYWLKGGIILFGTVVFFFYFKLPRLFMKIIIRPSAYNPAQRTALLTIFPGIFGYIVCVSTQATFMDFHSFWGLGFLFGAYLHIRKYGLSVFF